MAPSSYRQIAGAAWKLARDQHGTVTHGQLRVLGFTHEAIRHRIRVGRLFPVWPGVYSVGRPDLSRLGRWRAATLACGPGAALAGESGTALRDVRDREGVRIEIALPEGRQCSLPRITARRCRQLQSFTEHIRGIPVCSVPLLLVQLAAELDRDSIEAAINRADKLDLIDPDALRSSLAGLRGRPGVAPLRRILDRHTFRLSDSALERLFRPLARRAGLPEPVTGRVVNGWRVDFYWPALDYVVETDGLRYHRTPISQTRDLLRDQAHDAARTRHSRFSHAQIAFEPDYVVEMLRAACPDRS